MAWNYAKRIESHRWNDIERKAFQAGYSDGYYGYPKWSGCERNYADTAYETGYGEGDIDKREGGRNGA